MIVDEFTLDDDALTALLKSDEVQAVVDDAAEGIARRAESLSGRDYVAVQSHNEGRASAAVLPSGIVARRSENKNSTLRKALGGA